tara:strand:+ start:58542 stop:59306 length:765 start_codon:yes stop_codon:yes gene_type:complete
MVSAMPSIDENLNSWDKDWGHDGSEWSSAWGTNEAMWRHSVHSRIGRFLPAGSVLEIAPGRGRMTEFLLPLCQSYVGVDLAAECVKACQERFAKQDHATFATTSGTELKAVADASIDFAFSWDSLVHADAAVLRAYVSELARCLKPGGFAFLHHSNMHAYFDEASGKVTVENPHWRDTTVSADTVREACKAAGMHLRVQELLQWSVPHLSDCFSLMQRPLDAGQVGPELVRFEHPNMTSEMGLARILNESYWGG